MTEDEMAELRGSIVADIEQYFETYDWDKAFKRYMETQ